MADPGGNTNGDTSRDAKPICFVVGVESIQGTRLEFVVLVLVEMNNDGNKRQFYRRGTLI